MPQLGNTRTPETANQAPEPPTLVTMEEVAIALAPFAMQSMAMKGASDPKEYVTIRVRRETLTKANELIARIKTRRPAINKEQP